MMTTLQPVVPPPLRSFLAKSRSMLFSKLPIHIHSLHFLSEVYLFLSFCTRVERQSLEKEMATHSSTLAWEILWTEEPGGLESKASQRVRHDLVTKQQSGGHTWSHGHSARCICHQVLPINTPRPGTISVLTVASLAECLAHTSMLNECPRIMEGERDHRESQVTVNFKTQNIPKTHLMSADSVTVTSNMYKHIYHSFCSLLHCLLLSELSFLCVN